MIRNDGEIMENLLENTGVILLIEIGKMFIGVVVGSFILFGIPILIAIFAIFCAKIIKKINQLEKIDFKNNKEYYREILKNNSPLILGYLDKMELNKNIIIAELLFLKTKDIVNMKNNKIDNCKKSNYLHVCEEEFLQNIKNGKLVIKKDSFYNLRELVAYESEELKYVKEHKKKGKEFSGRLFIIISYVYSIYITLFGTVFGNFFENEPAFEKINIVNILLTALCLMPVAIFVVLCSYDGFEKMKEKLGLTYKRTAKGQELNKKLEGLKSYLKDYSLMDEREAKEIELWDDYLIYSVMFGQNKKIIEEYEKYIEIIE